MPCAFLCGFILGTLVLFIINFIFIILLLCYCLVVLFVIVVCVCLLCDGCVNVVCLSFRRWTSWGSVLDAILSCV